MPLKLINIGFGNIVMANRIIAIVSPDSAPIKRLIQEARKEQRVLDAVIITDDNRLILSSLQPETLANRITEAVNQEDDGE